MKQGLHHPVLMLLLVTAAALFGRVLPTWTLSLATIAASNALIALGIVMLIWILVWDVPAFRSTMRLWHWPTP